MDILMLGSFQIYSLKKPFAINGVWFIGTLALVGRNISNSVLGTNYLAASFQVFMDSCYICVIYVCIQLDVSNSNT